MTSPKPERSNLVHTHERLQSFLGIQTDCNCSDANDYLDKFEAHIEKLFIKTLHDVGIHATVKTEKFSLPYHEEITEDVRFQSYTNAVFDYRRIFRCALRELLDLDIHKIRFYIWTDLVERASEDGQPLRPDHPWRYAIRYHGPESQL